MNAMKDNHPHGTAAPGLCCLQGCLAASAVGFSFFIALPTGIILVVLSSSNHDNALLAAGCVLVSLPLVMLIIVIVLCLNQKRLKCLKKKIKRRKKVFEENSTIETTVTSGLSPSSTGFESPV
ncbi:uncharacterized protein LOC131930620 [Physella acuta]|uniref:uncharacterized protein LOC131930620 n=1 Tax=Physella acuta TaxID=109671 RepID=UPI0027DC9C98|nr:uncharacterized protein LOC131930620 [Physella acuta]